MTVDIGTCTRRTYLDALCILYGSVMRFPTAVQLSYVSENVPVEGAEA